MDADRLYQHIEVGNPDGRSPHLLLPLLGRFKGEYGDQMHIFPISNETCSGIHIRL